MPVAENAPGEARSVSDDTAQRVDQRTRILTTVVKNTLTAQPPDKWRRFGPLPAFRALDGPAELLMFELRRTFSPEELLAARVAREETNGELSLSRVFGNETSNFLMKGSPTPTDVLSVRGLLSAGRSRWCPFADDVAPVETNKSAILLATNDEEAWILARLGFNWAAGSEVLRLEGERVEKVFNSRSECPQQTSRTLTVIGWQLESLVNTPSAKTAKLIERLTKIQTVYGWDPATRFKVWLPSSEEVAAITDAHAFSDPNAVQRAFIKSLKNSRLKPSEALSALTPPQPPRFANARAALVEQVERTKRMGVKSDVIVEALESFRRAFEHDVLRPLEAFERSEAASPVDGMKVFSNLVVRDVMEDWFQHQELVRASRSAIAGQIPEYSKGIDDKDLIRSMKAIELITKHIRIQKL
jgi:hypothetical protein